MDSLNWFMELNEFDFILNKISVTFPIIFFTLDQFANEPFDQFCNQF